LKKKNKKKNGKGKKWAKGFPTSGESSRSSSSHKLLFRRGNITLARLLLTVSDAGSAGISTMNLFRQLGTTGYGQTTLRRAVKEGLIKRKEGDPPGPGQFPPVFNTITEKGHRLLQKQLL
jgi:hypothetical protein